MSYDEKPIDGSIEIVTPENIAFRYRLAGPFRRLPAFLIDLLLRVGVFFGLVFLLGVLGLFAILDGLLGMTLIVLSVFLMEWLYGGLLETFWNGQTVGKRVMGIRVLSTDGQPINGLQAVMRNILRFVDLMPMIPLTAFTGEPTPLPIPTCLIGLVTPILNPRMQRLGDLVCNTMVVVEEKTYLMGTVKLDDPRVALLAAEIPHSFRITRSLARALATYVERRQLFSPPRRREIARHLAEPLLKPFNLPADTSYDLLVCALYYRAFMAAEDEEVSLSNSFEESRAKRLNVGVKPPASDISRPTVLSKPIAGAPITANRVNDPQ